MDLSYLLEAPPADDVHKETRRRALGAMETGNIEAARTLLREYAAIFPQEARDLRIDIASTYGTNIR